MSDGTFAISRRQFYKAMADQPWVQAMARWGDRIMQRIEDQRWQVDLARWADDGGRA